LEGFGIFCEKVKKVLTGIAQSIQSATRDRRSLPALEGAENPMWVYTRIVANPKRPLVSERCGNRGESMTSADGKLPELSNLPGGGFRVQPS
jgi:hypothetical protein